MLAFRSAALAALFTLAAGPALAHTGVGAVGGLSAGFGHPIGGLDHILAMVAVGVLAAQAGLRGDRRALWLLPITFVVVMIVGGLLGVVGTPLPFVELGIVGSVIVLGIVIALGRSLPLIPAMGLVGLMAIFHGHAHGTEMPMDASALTYGLGFALATALLHGAGILGTLGLSRLAERIAPSAIRVGGAGIALAGLGLAAG